MGYILRMSFVLLPVILWLAGCGPGVGSLDASEGAPGSAELILPTPKPTTAPSPVSTRVLPLEVLTPEPTATITPIPDEALGLVVEVIDGDTVGVVMDGDPAERAYRVRYLGIDAPENSSASPWGVVAYETNYSLANLKVVRLVRDQTDFDDEGNLLRYVYVDNQLLNLILAEQGLARAAIEEPDTRFRAEILAAEARARGQQLGLWGQRLPTPTPGLGGGASSPISPTATISSSVVITATGEAEPTEETTPGTDEAEVTEEATVESTTTGTPESQ
jgi:micrococcal nuclease